MKHLLLILALFTSPLFAADTLLTAATGADESSSITLSGADTSGIAAHAFNKATLIIYAASGHTAAEYSDVQVSHDGGTTWADVYKDGVQIRLHSTNTVETVYGPGIYRVDKEATTNATGVFASHKNNP
ncbi:MAG: hypothetical protein IME93_03205 [Proteobacteria bacterium]|nr:hypothetical protein [Pseudomonadota bacterium]